MLGEDNATGGFASALGLSSTLLSLTAGNLLQALDVLGMKGAELAGYPGAIPDITDDIETQFSLSMSDDAFRPDEMTFIGDALQFATAGDIDSRPVYVHPLFAAVARGLSQYTDGVVPEVVQKYGEVELPDANGVPVQVMAPRYVIHDPLTKMLFNIGFGGANGSLRSIWPTDPEVLAARKDVLDVPGIDDKPAGSMPEMSTETMISILSVLAQTGGMKLQVVRPKRTASSEDPRYRTSTREPPKP